MAKERADNPRKEKSEKAEKKVSKDKVKKSKDKKRKSKHQSSSEASDNESIDVEDAPEVVEESSETKPEMSKKDKKKDKKEKKENKAKKAAETESNGASDHEDNGVALFTIDTNPTKVIPKTREEEDATEDDPKITVPPSGLNRQARRRIDLIERQREKIQKELGVPVGSLEKADEVQAILDKWTKDFDDKAAIRTEKKRKRHEKDAARLRNKRGKVLTGRRLKERTKFVNKLEKEKARKQQAGISANTEA